MTEETDTDPLRAFARALFAAAQSDDETDAHQDPTPPKPSGYVAREGNVTGPPAGGDMRDFARALFNSND